MTCPRCKRQLPSSFFAEPLRLCLVCYARQPGNEGLGADALRVKARKSWHANKHTRADERRLVERELFGASEFLCESCGAQGAETVRSAGVTLLLCATCMKTIGRGGEGG